jgi:hypothetical protein
MTRRWHPEGENEKVDGYIAEIRAILEEADKVLQEEEPYDYDLEDEVQHVILSHDEEVADAQAIMQDIDIDGDEKTSLEATTTETAETSITKTNTTEHLEEVLRAGKWVQPRLSLPIEEMEDRRDPARQHPLRFARHDV